MAPAPPDYGQLVDRNEESVEASSSYRVLRIAVPLVLGTGAGVVVGLAAAPLWAIPAAALAGAALGYVAVLIGAQIRARQLATQDFFVAWAEQRGLTYDPAPPVYDDTPFLRSGDDQFAHRGFEGTLAGRPGSVYQHTKRVKHRSTNSKGITTTSNDDTDYLVLRLDLSVPGFRRLELHPRSFSAFRVFDGIESTLTSNRVVELESEELARDYKLEVDDACDGVTLRQLFAPEAITRILDTFPRDVALELEGSTLVFFEEGSLTPKHVAALDELIAGATPFVAWLAAESTMMRT